MLQVGCHHNLSVETLRRIKPYAEKLAGRDITVPTMESPMTDEQALVRKIGRIIFSDIASFAPGTPVIQMSLSSQPSSAPPLTQEGIDRGNENLRASHARSMAMLPSIFKQLDILRTNGEDVFNEILSK